jgi:hypothetical protein
MTPPMMLPGMRLHLDGAKDPYIIEAGVFQRWDAARQTYVTQGSVIDLDGKSKPCAWDQAAGACTRGRRLGRCRCWTGDELGGATAPCVEQPPNMISTTRRTVSGSGRSPPFVVTPGA